ncbi:inosine guanosine and xanthosine phosphorylase family [Desulfovibrio sp. X2]|uniref:purine-nucleoside phosphorylase n=1 Tax=Desulfovibrio sp. X2 TaxID=941449 RepID=UPI000358AF57|nr:purine-nucleoside phosphorylase [Desulfovibrio sp. X2]EPR37342.1 inosine guanosine and xanthosine phosphorylase family [Desulfovibrio sp. X2]
MQNVQKVQQAATTVRERLGGLDADAVGVVLGTGLGRWAARLTEDRLGYAEIPGFPASTVPGHEGALLKGRIGGRQVLALSGRFHLYEGYSPEELCMGVRTLAAAGVRSVVLTNAAGALDPTFDVGSLMCITDHINWTGRTPLAGPNVDEWGPRFPDMSRVWSPRLRELAMRVALEKGVRLERGVYIQVPGPQMETPAETRAYRMLGAHAIGMSTVLEAVALRHMGVELLGISCLTNKNLPDCMEEAPLETVLAQASRSAGQLGELLDGIIVRI